MTVIELLADSGRAAAFADLVANPHGSVRVWAERWGWHRSKVERFLKRLESSGLMQFERSKTETRVSGVSACVSASKEDTETLKPESTGLSGGVSGVSVCHLDPGPLDHSRERNTVTPNYTEQLIAAMNGELSRIYGSDYRSVSSDQKGSHRAGDALQAAGVPVDFALERLLADCRTFNPSKHGRGKLPQSLNLFTRGILRSWSRRSQLELGLPPKLHIDRPDLPAPDRGGKPSPLGDAIGSWKDAFEAGQKTRARQ